METPSSFLPTHGPEPFSQASWGHASIGVRPTPAPFHAKLVPMKRLALIVALIAMPAAAQTNAFDRQLMELAGHFGTLHHLTQICEHEDNQIWRDAMLELISIEAPSRDQRNRMSERFNSTYHEVEQRFPSCSREARAYAADLSRAGASLTREMAARLR